VAENPLFTEIVESQRKFAERAVKWDLDTNVPRPHGLQHYFGKAPSGRGASREKT